jgi:hypothetical protein
MMLNGQQLICGLRASNQPVHGSRLFPDERARIARGPSRKPGRAQFHN